MKRRIVLELGHETLAEIIKHPDQWAQEVTKEFVRAAEQPSIDPCPTCDGVGCERCYTLGRRHLCKVDIAQSTTGRAVVQVWQGAPGTMQVVALTAPDRDLADDTIDAWLACLQNGGLIINDRRPR